MKAYRSKRYIDWLAGAVTVCQRTGPSDNLDVSHPPRKRPWIGTTPQGTFSPGNEKGSDYGCLMLDHEVHMNEHDGNIKWPILYGIPLRDILAVSNMIEYVNQELDPGIDLWAEMVEFAQARVKGMEPANIKPKAERDGA